MTWKEYIDKDTNNINKIFAYGNMWAKHGEATLYVTPEYIVEISDMIADGKILSNKGRLLLNEVHKNNKIFAKECYEFLNQNKLI